MTSGTEVLIGRDLSKTYGNRFTARTVQALDGVSFELREGEICGLVGPNGAGKSTLIKLIMGIEPKDRGEVSMNGLDPRMALGYVPERPTFFEDLSPFHNLLYAARLNDLPEPEEACLRGLREFGLEAWKDEPVVNFSKGMKQRLAIARSVLHRPKALIMDEPFSGLDPGMMMELRGIMKSLKGRGMAMLLSSHELNEIDQLCDSILFIKSGRIIKKEEFGAVVQTVNFRIMLASPNGAVPAALAGRNVLSQSPDGLSFLIETPKEKVPDIVAEVVEAGGRVVGCGIAQRKAEDLYAEVFQGAKA